MDEDFQEISPPDHGADPIKSIPPDVDPLPADADPQPETADAACEDSSISDQQGTEAVETEEVKTDSNHKNGADADREAIRDPELERIHKLFVTDEDIIMTTFWCVEVAVNPYTKITSTSFEHKTELCFF
ncbi:hypothetical protein R1flu_011374 [Riccia fluitans]|uniref:Uncharacterized protein n=1 Tax=Riccia fluitans TaxID=41844 RepID=A0ABD1ZBU0_9MARC